MSDYEADQYDVNYLLRHISKANVDDVREILEMAQQAKPHFTRWIDMHNLNGSTSLIEAIRFYCNEENPERKARLHEIINLLLANGANPNFSDLQTITAMHIAASSCGNIDILEKLLKHGGLVDVQTADQETPLFFAIYSHFDNIAIFLIDHKANIEHKNIFGETPLYKATEMNRPAIVQILLDDGANPDSQDLTGNTALHVAVIEDMPEIVRLLIEHGADERIDNEYKQSPIYLAEAPGHEEILEIMLETISKRDEERNKKNKARYTGAGKKRRTIKKRRNTGKMRKHARRGKKTSKRR
jgi:ankyrin repeat protein